MIRKLFLIAGHNGPGTGAKSFLDEGAETIWLRDKIDEILCMKYNFVAIVDKDDEKLGKVRDSIKKTIKDIDVSIDLHFNAFNGRANGVEVIVPDKATDDEKNFAQDMLDCIKDTLEINSRGIKSEGQSQHKSLAMLSGIGIGINVLVEVCFVDNFDDSNAYTTTKGLLAEKMADVLAKWCIPDIYQQVQEYEANKAS